MSGEALSEDLLKILIDEIRGLRDDIRRKRVDLPDVKIGKSKAGPQYEGKAASECPANFLLEYAGYLEWRAGKNREEGKDQYATQADREALTCRRWATVNRGVIAAPEKPAFRRPAEPTPEAATNDTAAPATKSTWGGSTWGRKAG